MFPAKVVIHWTFRRTTFRVLLQHRYGIKSRAGNSELAKHFHESHNLDDDLNVTILQNNIKTAAARRYHEGKLIWKLETVAPDTEIGDFVKEWSNFY